VSKHVAVWIARRHCCGIQGNAIPIRDLDRPRGFQEFEVPTFQDNWHLKVIRLSALAAFIPMKYSWYSFLLLES